MKYSKEQFQTLMKPYFDGDWLAVYQQALQQEPEALYIVADMYRAHDLHEDYIQLLYTLHKRGEAHASYLLGNCYIEGYGVEESYEQALELYTTAAKAGHADAMNNLADMYVNGEGTAVDEQQALYWFEQAAALGVAEAMFTLGMMHEQGIGVPADDARAVAYYIQSAAHDYVEAHYYLAMIYLQGTHGQAVQIERALELFERAEQAMHVDAIFNLGYIYEQGLHVPVNGAKAVHYYKKAAFMGDEQAREQLAAMYEAGTIVARDDVQAKKWRNYTPLD